MPPEVAPAQTLGHPPETPSETAFRPNRARKGGALAANGSDAFHVHDANKPNKLSEPQELDDAHDGASILTAVVPADRPENAAVFAAFQAFADSLASYLKPDEIALVEQAFNLGVLAHEGQTRATGEPYITHPLAVAELCASWKLDHAALIAALLHDTLEDTRLTKAEIEAKFGPSVANMVDGLSKLDKVQFQSKEDHQAENFRKMLLAMAQDVRVILVKLADRLHNMRTMEAMAAHKRYRIGRETLDIYAPIAHRLGLNQVYRELQDLSFTNAFPYRSRILAKAVKVARGTRREVVGKVMAEITKMLPERGIVAQVYGREKHLYGIYKKMSQKHLSFSEVLDIYGFRVVVNDPGSCYLALGALHALYKPVPGKFKDYIAIPKVNGYQSLHTTLVGPFGTPIEVQVRSQEMHRIAESGVAAHWLYKSGEEQIGEVQKKTHQWLQSLLDIQNDSRDPAEFLEHVKVDLFPDDVYVFTPKGKILPMPRGATVVDFAYMIHTDIGDQCVGVRINGQPAPLRSELRNGDVVQIETSKHSRPNPAWLAFVRTGRARSRIRHYLKTMQFDESAALGERLLAQALNSLGEGQSALDGARWDKLMKEVGVKSRQELLADIGLGRRLPAVVARRLAALGETKVRESAQSSAEPTSAWQRLFGSKAKKPGAAAVLIRGADGIAVQLASCCRPIPGDPIIGHISKGQGLTIHTHDCKTIAKARLKDPDHWVDVEWSPDPEKLFSVVIRATVSNGRGILAKVAASISAAEANITNVLTADDESGKYATMEFTMLVSDRMHLAQVLKNMRRVQEVVRVNRVQG